MDGWVNFTLQEAGCLSYGENGCGGAGVLKEEDAAAGVARI